jgi:L-2-hydroxyglutarate oxidase
MAGQPVDFQIIPFRGVYYELIPEARKYCRSLVYPVPDPAFPFLGIHFTRTLDGRIECGPNAVLATGREAYSLRSFSAKDIREMLSFRGFRVLAKEQWKRGLLEMARTVSTRQFVRALQSLIPLVERKDVVRTRSGIRAQAVDSNGHLIDDFLIEESERMISVFNAPSPAATACLRIGEQIAARVRKRLG